jgi:murein DD-endopeptidase MepM/ murein hydrolase activator NlpD
VNRALALAAVLLAAAAGCRSTPAPGRGPGTWVVVRAGDNLWGISQRHGVPVDAIRRVNRVDDVRTLRIGQRLWVPGGSEAREDDAPGRAGPVAAPGLSTPLPSRSDGDCGAAARADALAFEWPVLGRPSSSFGEGRAGRRHDGVDLLAERGTEIRAAEAGKVVYAGDDLGDYGRVVIVKHQGSWATVYAHNDGNLVEEGDFIEKGDVIARVGRTGNATASHLHFEIRHDNRARDPLSCLP